MTNVQKAEATLKCTSCGHSVPPPAESTSDETLHRLSGLRSESRIMGRCEKRDRAAGARSPAVTSVTVVTRPAGRYRGLSAGYSSADGLRTVRDLAPVCLPRIGSGFLLTLAFPYPGALSGGLTDGHGRVMAASSSDDHK